MTLLEASKLNPGKRMIMGAQLGSKNAKNVVDVSTQALKAWPELDKEKKAAVYQKLAALKATAKETLSNDLKKVPAEKKAAAKETADAIFLKFKEAVKKREAAAKETPKETEKEAEEEAEETDAEFEERIKKEIEDFKSKRNELDDDIRSIRKEIKDIYDDIKTSEKEGDDEMVDQLKINLENSKKEIAELEEEIESINDQIEMRKMDLGESRSYSMKYVKLFEQFINENS